MSKQEPKIQNNDPKNVGSRFYFPKRKEERKKLTNINMKQINHIIFHFNN